VLESADCDSLLSRTMLTIFHGASSAFTNPMINHILSNVVLSFGVAN